MSCQNRKRSSRQSLLTKKKFISILMKNLQKLWETGDNFRGRRTAGRSSKSSPQTSNSRGVNVRVPECDPTKSHTEFWRDTDLSFSFQISSHQTGILINPCPVFAAHWSFESASSNLDASFKEQKPVNSETIMVLSFNWAQVPQLLQTCSTSESHHHSAWNIDHESSSTQIFLQNYTYECASSSIYYVWGANNLSAE